MLDCHQCICLKNVSYTNWLKIGRIILLHRTYILPKRWKTLSSLLFCSNDIKIHQNFHSQGYLVHKMNNTNNSHQKHWQFCVQLWQLSTYCTSIVQHKKKTIAERKKKLEKVKMKKEQQRQHEENKLNLYLFYWNSFICSVDSFILVEILFFYFHFVHS